MFSIKKKTEEKSIFISVYLNIYHFVNMFSSNITYTRYNSVPVKITYKCIHGAYYVVCAKNRKIAHFTSSSTEYHRELCT